MTTTAPPATDQQAPQLVELAIEGMTCAACAVRVEKKLNRLDAVTASVSYATGTARVTAPAAMPVADLDRRGRTGRVQRGRARP